MAKDTMNRSGKPDSTVDMRTGKVNFSVVIAKLNTPGGAELNLNVKYQSNLLKDEYSRWNREDNAGVVATGWSLNCNDQVFVLDGTVENRHYMSFKGVIYEIVLVLKGDRYDEYRTRAQSNYLIRYDTSKNIWNVFDDLGIKYIFGWDNIQNLEKGLYDIAKGTYAEASASYQNVRKLISFPDENDVPSDGKVDNTICSSAEQCVVWDNGWSGPSYNVGQQVKVVSVWRLSQILDAFENTIAFSYIQHLADVCPVDGSKQYTIASYLYRVKVLISNVEVETLVFDYATKDTCEYHVEYTLYPRPNGIQQKYQKLHLSKIAHYKYQTEKETIYLDTELYNPDDTYSELRKRQLKEIRYTLDGKNGIQFTPSYRFEYFTESDGVSVGGAGFSTSQAKYFNQKTGALYGNLKSIIFPSGKFVEYKYSEIRLSSVSPQRFDTLDVPDANPENVITVHTPYGYCLAIVKSSNNKSKFYIYSWTLYGWTVQLLGEYDFVENYNPDSSVTFSEHILGYIEPNYKKYHIWSRSNVQDGLWDDAPFNRTSGGTIMYGPISKAKLCVDDYGVIVTTLNPNDPPERAATAYYFYTDDFGSSFTPSPKDFDTETISSSASSFCMLARAKDGWFIIVLSPFTFTILPSNWPESAPKPTFERAKVKIAYVNDHTDESKIFDFDLNPVVKQTHMFYGDPQPTAQSIAMITGGKIKSTLDARIVGSSLFIRFKSVTHTAFYNRYYHTLVEEDSGEGDWGIAFLYDSIFQVLSKYADDEYIDDRNYTDKMFVAKPSTESISTSFSASGNGCFYTYFFNPDKFFRSGTYQGTITFTYNGRQVVKSINNDDKNYACMFKDDFMAVLYSVVSPDNVQALVYKKIYVFLDQNQMKWRQIATGTIDFSEITFNKQESDTVKSLGYVGLALSIILLPFGLTSIVGAVVTAISISLMAGTYVAQTLLENSGRISLEPSVAYYGDRFINDGNTVWFRENGQDRVTAVGSGSTYQVGDALSGGEGSIIGKVLENKQQFGSVYNYVPFYTSEDRMYYRCLKNSNIGEANPFGVVAEGCNDFYTLGNEFFMFNGSYRFKFNQDGPYSGIKEKIENIGMAFSSIDACAILRNSSWGSDKYKILFIAGSKYCFYDEESNIYTPPESIRVGFVGCTFAHVDAALEKIGSDGITSSGFYLFCDDLYEFATITNSGITITDRGTINSYNNNLPLDKIDAAGFFKGQNVFMRNNFYVKCNRSTGIIEAQGELGQTHFYETIGSDTKLNFNHDQLSLYFPSTKEFRLYRYINDSLQGSLTDYVVGTVASCNDPRNIIDKTATTLYQYDTESSCYLQAIKSPIYRQIDAVAVNEEDEV